MPRIDIQAAIAAVITAAGGLNVHGDALGVVRARQTSDYITEYVDNVGGVQTVHAWFVGRIATPQQTAESGGNRTIEIRHQLNRLHRFQIYFFYGYRSAVSEAAFQTIVDTVLSAFDNERTLGGWQARPIQLMSADTAQLGDVTCHRATFQIDVIEMVQGLSPH